MNVTVVPEPSTLLLLFVVLVAVGVLATYRKARPLGIALLCAGGLLFVLLIVGYRFAKRTAVAERAASIEYRNAPDPNRLTRSPASRNGRTTMSRSADVSVLEGSDIESIRHFQKFVDEHNSRPSQTDAKVAPPPASPASGSKKAAKKAEADPAEVVAARAVGMIEAIGHALSNMLTEAKKPVVATKPEAKPAPVKRSPDWVNAPPRVNGDSYEMSIVVGPWKTLRECEADLPKELQKALDRYVEACEPGSRHVVLPASYLRQHLVKGQWEEDIQSDSVGAMKQLHVLLQFDREVRNRILVENSRGEVAGRLCYLGLVLAGVFWPLAVAYGYLRLDLATGGIYRGRLRFAAGLAILGPVAAVLAVVS